jgi:hypothetical protein
LATDAIRNATSLSPEIASSTVAVPAVVYLLAVSILHVRRRTWRALASVAVTGLVLLVAAITARWVGVATVVLIMGLLLGGLVATYVAAPERESNPR